MNSSNMEPVALPLEEIFNNDLSIMTYSFMGDDYHEKQIIDPGQRPVFVKIENVLESKATEEAVKELNMGHEYGINQQIKEPTLQDAIECPDDSLLIPRQHNTDAFDSVSYIDEINTYELRDMLHCLTNDNIEIRALPSRKKKNPPYKVEGKDITTLNRIPVSFILSGVEPEHSVHVSLRYIDEIFKNRAVNPCKIHQDWKEGPKNLPLEFNFHLTRECSYEIKDSHPTAVVNIDKDSIDADEMVKFSIVFLCLSSCHKVNGKKTEVVITVLNSDRTLVLREERFPIRICRNVKRDHKQKYECNLKRKSSFKECTGEVSMKVQRVENEISQDLLAAFEATSGNNKGKPGSYAFQMKSKDHEDILLKLIKELGGNCYPIQTPFEETLPSIP